ncbi:MFS general substrate transporter [Schizopora paradoxa]|uniref:MFS general substrate transporter n=1 Tax=Schizopora paradoxa TaxID=27342 RepID=A0A0H2RG81_9AGAM|nr:MFS general substrate transporter [Schizopora paradoxa]
MVTVGVDVEDERKSSKGSAVDVDVELEKPDNSRSPASKESTLVEPKDLLEAEREATRAAIHDPEDAEKSPFDDYPDGGTRAWLCLMGSYFYQSFGFVNSWGVFQSYYQQTLLKDESSSNIAWIGSVQYALTFAPSLITGRLFDLGYLRVPLFFASCLMIVGTFLTAQCTKYWHFILCQGIVIGISSGLVFGPATAVISHWWKRRRGFALGLLACGSSIGGTSFPIIFQKLVFKIGFPWTMRVIGFILICTLAFANLTLRRRLPPVNVSGGLFNLRAFRSPRYTVYTIAGCFSFLGLYTVLTYINISAVSNGVDENFAFYLVSIANASSFFGRLGGGLLADRIGAINVMSPFTLVAGIMTYVWPYVSGKSNYITIAVIYGFASGAFVSLISAPMIAFGEVSDVGRRTGLYFSVLALAAVAGPPISGAINTATGGFHQVGIFAGTMVVVSVVIMWIARCMVLGSFWGKF